MAIAVNQNSQGLVKDTLCVVGALQRQSQVKQDRRLE